MAKLMDLPLELHVLIASKLIPVKHLKSSKSRKKRITELLSLARVSTYWKEAVMQAVGQRKMCARELRTKAELHLDEMWLRTAYGKSRGHLSASRELDICKRRLGILEGLFGTVCEVRIYRG